MKTPRLYINLHRICSFIIINILLYGIFSIGSWGWCLWNWYLSGYVLRSSCIRCCFQAGWNK